jgi:hypothetical protein
MQRKYVAHSPNSPQRRMTDNVFHFSIVTDLLLRAVFSAPLDYEAMAPATAVAKSAPACLSKLPAFHGMRNVSPAARGRM